MVCIAVFDAQVGILVDDGTDEGSGIVEAGELETVAARAEFYDVRLGETVGCDPAGCQAALTRVSVWRCRPPFATGADRWLLSLAAQQKPRYAPFASTLLCCGLALP